MFNVGDIVKIDAQHPENCHPNSHVIRLKGTVAEIKSVEEKYVAYKHSPYVYRLKFLEIHSSNPTWEDELSECMDWRDEHLTLAKEYNQIQELDTSILFLE